MLSNDDNHATNESRRHPDWLPGAVSSWIDGNRDHLDHLHHAALIDHLAADLRLKPLWVELTKRKPIGFVHQVNKNTLARLTAPPLPAAEDDLHNIGLVLVFKNILHVAISLYAAKSEADRSAQAADMRRRAAALRAEADDTDLMPAGEIDWLIVSAGMRVKADVLDRAAEALGAYRLAVPNERPNMSGIGTAWRISGALQAIFGQPLYKQSAVIASILTGEAVTPEQVRDITRNQPPHVTFTEKVGAKSHR